MVKELLKKHANLEITLDDQTVEATEAEKEVAADKVSETPAKELIENPVP